MGHAVIEVHGSAETSMSKALRRACYLTGVCQVRAGGVTNSYSCTITESVSVTVIPTGIRDGGKDQIICFGDSAFPCRNFLNEEDCTGVRSVTVETFLPDANTLL